jgi:Transposase DDE domain
VIELCANMFDWARYRRSKGAMKLHLLLDHDGCLPVYAHVTEGAVADVTIAKELILPPGSIVAMDRGYNVTMTTTSLNPGVSRRSGSSLD